MGRSFSSWHPLWLLVGIGAAVFVAPGPARADDPVENLKKTLKDKRWQLAARDTEKFATLSELRRGYFFLSDYTRDLTDKTDAEQKKALEKLRDGIANQLVQRIGASARGDSDRQIAACILIAEIAESDQPEQRGLAGKFASKLSGLLLGTKGETGLVRHEDVRVRQAALHALGKITPNPAEAMPALKLVLNRDDLGPRRLAAYALTDLVKNAAFLQRAEEMATMNQAVAAAARVLVNRAEDEQIRGYCLQTILISARVFTDYRWATRFGDRSERPIIEVELDKKLNKQVVTPGLQELLKTYQNAIPQIVGALETDPSAKIKLTALETIGQIIAARHELCEKLQEERDLKANAMPLSRSELLEAFKAPDPIRPLLDGQRWVVIPAVFKQSEDERLKRGAMSLLERVAKDVEATQTPAATRLFVKEVTPALSDPDRYVRWSAARTLGHISPEYLGANDFVALGKMLIDPIQRDPDLSAAAAATIERIAAAPSALEALVFLRSAIADPTMDRDNRIAALKALVAIGAATPKSENKEQLQRRQEEANKAFPQVTSAVGADDTAVRREACRTLGLLGHPASVDYYRAAIEALKAALRDDDTEVRLEASEAILTITAPQ